MVVDSVKQYHQRRWEALSEICGHHIPMCEVCGKLLSIDVDELHVHHVDPNEGYESGIRGWQHLLRIEEDIEEGVELEVNCRRCHEWQHNMQTTWEPQTPEGVTAQ